MNAKLFYQIYNNISFIPITKFSPKSLVNVYPRARTKINITRKKHSLTISTLNPQLKNVEYAIRGALFIKAEEIEKELAKGVKKNFTHIIRTNIGDCHAMGQAPITFMRQVLALVTYPKLLKDSHFPSDAKERAETLLEACRGRSVGSYSDSPGIELIRKHVAEYITRRDGGIASKWENIILCTGASTGITNMLKLLICEIQGKKPGVLVPIPTYPLYSATLTEFAVHQIDYYLDESNNWAVDVLELEKAFTKAKTFCFPRALVVINPGNPTGQVLTRKNIEEIVKFAFKLRLFVMADEVYQYNVYDEASKFHSFKKVMTEMGEPYNKMELASFMSCSKGYTGECGIRGGCIEIINMNPQVKKIFLKAISASLCPTVLGQIAMDVVVNPPKENEPSYNQFMEEKAAVLQSLKLKAKLVTDGLNSCEGVSCNTVQGAMYAFPQIKLPPKAIEHATKQRMEPDVYYTLELLENTGICVIPGSGFGQKPGTHHFRTTTLPQTDDLKIMLQRFKEFNVRFVKTYS